MSRRIVLFLASLAVLVALAVAPWTISSPRLKEQIVEQLRTAYGLHLVASGQTTLALLPVPRLKLTGVSLATPDGSVLVEGAQFRGELQLLPLIVARLDLTDISIVRGTMRVQVRADGSTSWDPVLTRVKESLTGGAGRLRLRRLIIQHTRIVLDDLRRKRRTELGAVDLVARWPARNGALEVTASAVWNGEPVIASLSGLVPAELASGQRSHVDLRVASRNGEATVSGVLALDEPRFDGDILASARSLKALVAWTGLARPSPAMAGPLQLAGPLALSPHEITLPRVSVTAGAGTFDGAIAIRLDQDRRAVRATLAGESLDLTSAASAALADAASAATDLAALRQADLDLRVSASSVSAGSMQLHDVALGVLTSADRVEFSLGRASMAGGVVKGRLSLACSGDGYAARLQSSFNKVDAARLLAELGQGRLLSGTAQGQATLEADGMNLAEIVRSLSGRLELSVREGEISGILLGQPGARGAELVAQTNSRRTGPRTPFQDLALDFNLANGRAELAAGTLDGPGLHAALKGQIMLPDRMLSLTATTGAPADAERDTQRRTVEISGPWASPSVRPIPAAARP